MPAVRCVVCLGAILTIDFALDMDSDNEMLALLLEDEKAFDDDLREHLWRIKGNTVAP